MLSWFKLPCWLKKMFAGCVLIIKNLAIGNQPYILRPIFICIYVCIQIVYIFINPRAYISKSRLFFYFTKRPSYSAKQKRLSFFTPIIFNFIFYFLYNIAHISPLIKFHLP
ncbi:hypothetical protein BN1200_1240005 [Klebsiella variicola]|nr:hypothetical protein BN1200_1240005 [Klebsiella variicola]